MGVPIAPGPYTAEQAAQFGAAVRASVQALSDHLDEEYLSAPFGRCFWCGVALLDPATATRAPRHRAGCALNGPIDPRPRTRAGRRREAVRSAGQQDLLLTMYGGGRRRETHG